MKMSKKKILKYLEKSEANQKHFLAQKLLFNDL